MFESPLDVAVLLDTAAAQIIASDEHPGQVFPGVWKIGGENSPERVISVVAASALAKVCAQRGVDLEAILKSYVLISRNVALTPRGAPDTMAATHLRDAATELRRSVLGHRPLLV